MPNWFVKNNNYLDEKIKERNRSGKKPTLRMGCGIRS
jgi:hypothetical protein